MRRWPFPILAGVALTSTMLVAVTPQAAPQAPATAPAGAMRFTTLPGFTIERLVPAGKTRLVRRPHVRQPGPPGRLEGARPSAPPDRRRQGRRLRVGEGVQRRRCGTARASGSTGGRSMARARPVKPRLPATAGEPPAPQRSGLYRMEDTNGDDVADTFEELAAFVGGIQEHGPHAIRRGPDGEMTIMIGNNTYVADESWIDPLLAVPRRIRESQLLPGAARWPRLRPQHQGRTARHASCASIARARPSPCCRARCATPTITPSTSSGEAFTFDSDMEWDINMPWYREVRTVHLHSGQRQRLPQRIGQVPALLPRFTAAGARPRARIAGGRRVLSASRLPGGVPRRLPRGRLVARPAALDRPRRAGRRTYTADEGEGRVRPRRAAEHHRSRSRARRVRLLHDWRAHAPKAASIRVPLHGHTAPRAPRPPASSRSSVSRSRCRAGAGRRSRRRRRRWARLRRPSSRSSHVTPRPSSDDRAQARLHPAAPRRRSRAAIC